MDVQLQADYSKMVKTLAKSGGQIIAELTPLNAHLWHMASCVLGEVGELDEAEATANLESDEGMLAFVKELGDIEFYLEGIRQHVGYNAEQHLEVSRAEGNTVDILFRNAAKLFDKVKRVAIYAKPFEENKGVILDALIKTENCFQAYLNYFEISRDLIRRKNIEKLSARYGEALKYSNQAAVERKDEKEWS